MYYIFNMYIFTYCNYIFHWGLLWFSNSKSLKHCVEKDSEVSSGFSWGKSTLSG